MKNGTIAALLVVLIVVSGVAGFFIGSANIQTVTRTSTQVSVVTTTQTTTNRLGELAQGESIGASGIGLSLAINSTVIRPNGTISLTVDEFNALSVPVNISASSQWMVQGLSEGCPSFVPDGFGVLRGYYTPDNVSDGRLLNIFSPPMFCPVAHVYNVTNGVSGRLVNLTSYSFLPHSDNASYFVYYVPDNTLNVTKGIFGPDQMGGFPLTISATSESTSHDSLGSAAPATYTVVAGDEWGNLVVLHFSVVAAG